MSAAWALSTGSTRFNGSFLFADRFGTQTWTLIWRTLEFQKRSAADFCGFRQNPSARDDSFFIWFGNRDASRNRDPDGNWYCFRCGHSRAFGQPRSYFSENFWRGSRRHRRFVRDNNFRDFLHRETFCDEESPAHKLEHLPKTAILLASLKAGTIVFLWFKFFGKFVQSDEDSDTMDFDITEI